MISTWIGCGHGFMEHEHKKMMDLKKVHPTAEGG